MNILSKFETLSSLSSAQLDLSILKLMSKIENSDSDLHGDRQTKAKWILNMVILISMNALQYTGCVAFQCFYVEKRAILVNVHLHPGHGEINAFIL